VISQRGFTLLELLISVALLVLLTTILFEGLRLGTHHLGQQSDRLDRASRIALAQNFLRAQLADARPVTTPATAQRTIVFDGRPDGIEFISVAPESVAVGGLQALSVDYDKGTGTTGGELLLRWRPYGGTSPTVPSTVRNSLLLDHVRSAEFAYFGTTSPDQPSVWHVTWQDMAYLPSLVRVSLEFSDGQRMPELIVALRLSPAGTTSLQARGSP
jgi:prepilin-type N-terminal cleavage/methylation domain-containing protein